MSVFDDMDKLVVRYLGEDILLPQDEDDDQS